MCPWDNWTPATLKFCERELCSWIAQPANTWTNIAFFIAAWWIWRDVRGRHRSLLLFPIASAAIGVGSTLFHASGRVAFQILDVSAMFLISGLLIVFNAERWDKFPRLATLPIYFGLVATSTLIMMAVPELGEPIFAIQCAIVCTLELVFHIKDFGKTDYRWLAGGIGSFIVAFTFWNLDIHGIVCDPDLHWISGHGAWHVFNAVAICSFYRYFCQFSKEPSP